MGSGVQPALELRARYAEALRSWLATPAAERTPAGEALGRSALSAGRTLSELAMIHHETLAALLGSFGPEEQPRILGEAQQFFCDCIAPFDALIGATHRADVSVQALNIRFEEQARRIARALHDDVGQLVACVQMALDEIAADLPCGDCERFRIASRHLDELESHLRDLSHELRPMLLDDLGLVPALESLAEGVHTRRGIEVRIEGTIGGRLPADIELHLYRIAQEGIKNAARHSGAKSVTVRIEHESDAVCLIVRDDGAGFDPEAVRSGQHRRGLGLISIEERAAACRGTVRIHSAPGRGTEIVVRVPLGA